MCDSGEGVGECRVHHPECHLFRNSSAPWKGIPHSRSPWSSAPRSGHCVWGRGLDPAAASLVKAEKWDSRGWAQVRLPNLW